MTLVEEHLNKIKEHLDEIDDAIKTVFIVAHNPGITEFINELSDQFYTDNMPTCGVVGAKFEAEQWNEFNRTNKTVFLYDYPKNEI
jgi:phosphohistidine phosphatase